MKKIIIFAGLLFLIVMLGTTLSKKPSVEKSESVSSEAPPEPSPQKKVVPQIKEDPNEPKTLSEACFAVQHNRWKIRELGNEVRTLEKRVSELEANEKKNLYQQKRLENRLRSLEQKGFYRK